MNRVELIGNLGRDAEVKTYGDNKVMVILSVATSNDYKDTTTNEWVKRPADWHRITIFKPAAVEFARNLKSGARVHVKGSLKTNRFTDSQTGEERYSTEVLVQGPYASVREPQKKEGAEQKEAA
jgi:single-strand DNA-binding protein